MVFKTFRKSLSQLSFQNLHDPKRYEFQIEKAFHRIKTTQGVGALFEISQEDVPFFSFGYDRENLSKVLSESVKSESYFLSPPNQCFIHIKEKNKDRIIYKFNPMDKIIIGTLGSFLVEVLSPFLSPHVYSYQKGVSPLHEVKALSHFIKRMRKKGHERFFLFQTDIAAYSDEVDVQQSSYFWEVIDDYFKTLHLNPSPYHRYLIEESIRPSFLNPEGHEVCNLKGVPTGSPITPFIYNFYVSSVDNKLDRDENTFYGRYADDIILCDTDPNRLQECVVILKEELKKLRLRLSEKKTETFNFSLSGNNHKEPQNAKLAFKQTNRLDILGYSLKANGSYFISYPRRKKLLKKIKVILKNTHAIIKNEPIETQGTTLSHVVNDLFFDPHKITTNVMRAIFSSNDLNELKWLDHYAARSIAETLTGIYGQKAFRSIPYEKIRTSWGLKSLLVERFK